MQLKIRFLLLFIVSSLTLASFVGLGIIRYAGLTPPSYSITVPENTEWQIRLDALNWAKEELYTVLFEAKEEQLITAFETIIENKTMKDGESRSLGIELEQALILFGIKEKGHSLIGISIKLSDVALFKKNNSYFINDHQGIAIKDDHAILLTDMSQNPLAKNVLTRIAEKYIQKSKEVEIIQSNKANATFLSMKLREGGIEGEAKDVTADVAVEDQTVRIRGELTLDQTRFHKPAFSLKRKGLYISTSLIPKNLTDTLNALLPLGTYRFPQVRSIVCDLQGAMIEQSSMGLIPAPKMNLILEMERPINLDSIMASIPVDMVQPGNKVIVGSLTYQIDLLNPTTLFIGTDRTQVTKQDGKHVSEIVGDLRVLTSIGGSPMIMAFLEVIPIFSASKQFVETTDHVKFIIHENSNGQCTMTGSLEFKKGLNPRHELTKLVLGTGLLTQ